MNDEVYTDMLGQEIRVGDFVVYATTSGRSPVQKFARVEQFKFVYRVRCTWPEGVGYGKPRGEETYVYVKVGVREISNGRNFKRYDRTKWVSNETGEYSRVDKEVRVTYPLSENIVKVGGPE